MIVFVPHFWKNMPKKNFNEGLAKCTASWCSDESIHFDFEPTALEYSNVQSKNPIFVRKVLWTKETEAFHKWTRYRVLAFPIEGSVQIWLQTDGDASIVSSKWQTTAPIPLGIRWPEQSNGANLETWLARPSTLHWNNQCFLFNLSYFSRFLEEVFFINFEQLQSNSIVLSVRSFSIHESWGCSFSYVFEKKASGIRNFGFQILEKEFKENFQSNWLGCSFQFHFNSFEFAKSIGSLGSICFLFSIGENWLLELEIFCSLLLCSVN